MKDLLSTVININQAQLSLIKGGTTTITEDDKRRNRPGGGNTTH